MAPHTPTPVRAGIRQEMLTTAVGEDPEWTVLKDPEAVARIACDRISIAAHDAINARHRFTIVLAGGTTPERVYRLLAASEQDWSHWHVFVGDERYLPEGDSDLNSSVIKRTLLDHVSIPESQVHMIPVELGVEQAAIEYTKTISGFMPFDLVLLGMGEDGHTASLFPGHTYPEEALVVPVYESSKPPPQRVSLAPRALGNCHRLIYLVTGKGKQHAVAAWRSGQALPVSHVASAGKAEVLIDEQAWKN